MPWFRRFFSLSSLMVHYIKLHSRRTQDSYFLHTKRDHNKTTIAIYSSQWAIPFLKSFWVHPFLVNATLFLVPSSPWFDATSRMEPHTYWDMIHPVSLSSSYKLDHYVPSSLKPWIILWMKYFLLQEGSPWCDAAFFFLEWPSILW